MTHTNSCLEVLFARPILAFTDKSHLVPIFNNAGVGHIGNSRSNPVMPPSHQQRRKPPLITYLFYAADKKNVHLRACHTAMRGSGSAQMLPLPTLSTSCSILGMMILTNQRRHGYFGRDLKPCTSWRTPF